MAEETVSAQDYKETIRRVLAREPITRDNDIELFSEVLIELGYYPNEMTVNDYLNMLIQGKVPSWDTVTRLRRLIQTEYLELRGAKYESRHNREKDVESDLGYKRNSSYLEEELFERNEQ